MIYLWRNRRISIVFEFFYQSGIIVLSMAEMLVSRFRSCVNSSSSVVIMLSMAEMLVPHFRSCVNSSSSLVIGFCARWSCL